MFGDTLQDLRKRYKMSQVGLAKELGVTKQAVSNWEKNNIIPSIDMLVKIARIFSVSTDYLLGIDSGNHINVEGLTLEQVIHIQLLINDIKNPK